MMWKRSRRYRDSIERVSPEELPPLGGLSWLSRDVLHSCREEIVEKLRCVAQPCEMEISGKVDSDLFGRDTVLWKNIGSDDRDGWRWCETLLVFLKIRQILILTITSWLTNRLRLVLLFWNMCKRIDHSGSIYIVPDSNNRLTLSTWTILIWNYLLSILFGAPHTKIRYWCYVWACARRCFSSPW